MRFDRPRTSANTGVAGELGFEPRLTESESAVLPLNYPPKQPGREEYSYPSIMQTRDGKIMVAFTYRRQTIKVVSFPEDWIKQGGTVGEHRGEN